MLEEVEMRWWRLFILAKRRHDGNILAPSWKPNPSYDHRCICWLKSIRRWRGRGDRGGLARLDGGANLKDRGLRWQSEMVEKTKKNLHHS